jgi:hypothetical protein
LHMGQTDKIGSMPELYEIPTELLKECMISDRANVNDNHDNRSRVKTQATTTTTLLYDIKYMYTYSNTCMISSI